MIKRLTSDEMLQIWRERAGLEPINTDCSIERFDGIDLNAMIRQRMRQWYLAMLDEGRPEYLGTPSEAAELFTVTPDGRITADGTVRRTMTLQLSSWKRPAAVKDIADIAGLVPLEANLYSAAGEMSPLAWRESSGIIRVTPCTTSDAITSALAYTDPGEDLYILDERGLSTIPTDLIQPS